MSIEFEKGATLGEGIRLSESLGAGRGWLATREGDSLRVYPTDEDLEALPADQARSPFEAAPLACGEGWAAFEYTKLTLADRLAGPAPLDPEDCLRLAGEVLEGLEATATPGVDPGPLHPGRVLLDADDRVRLLPRACQAAEDEAQVAPFRAPEVRPGSPPSQSAGVYSAGALLYAMLTGAPPPSCPAPAPSSQRAESPAWLDRVVLMALEPDPGHRYAAYQTFRSALGASLDALRRRRSEDAGGDVHTTRPPPMAASPRMHPSGRWGLQGMRPTPMPGIPGMPAPPAAVPAEGPPGPGTGGGPGPEPGGPAADRNPGGGQEADGGANPEARFERPATGTDRAVPGRHLALGETPRIQDRAGISRGGQAGVDFLRSQAPGTEAPASAFRFSWKVALTRGFPVLLVLAAILVGLIALFAAALS